MLVNFGASVPDSIAGWEDRIRYVEAEQGGALELPGIGEVPAPSAVLVRPDGHVAGVGEVADPTLRDALTTWFGAARAVVARG